MRKKLMLGVFVTALALVAAPIALAVFTQTAEVKFITKSGAIAKKPGTAAGIRAKLHSEDPDAPGGKPKIASKVVVKLAAGSRYDVRGAKTCTLSDAEILAGQCPAASKLGSGSANANAYPLLASVPEDITIWHGNHQIIFALKPKGAIGQTFVIRGKISDKGVLTTNVPPLTLPTNPPTSVALTDFEVRLNPKSRRVGGKKRILLRTPKTCKTGKWTHRVSFTYTDGSRLSRTSKHACRKTS